MTRKFDAWARANSAKFYPVHPRYETILGHTVYPSLADVPGDIDLAIILTGQAVDTFEEVLASPAKFAVIFAAGFSETGKDGAKLERRLHELVQSGDVRLLGPNTNGIINTGNGFTATFSPVLDQKGFVLRRSPMAWQPWSGTMLSAKLPSSVVSIWSSVLATPAFS